MFIAQGERVNALACNSKTLAIWLCTLCNAVLGELPSTCKVESPAAEVSLSTAQLREASAQPPQLVPLVPIPAWSAVSTSEPSPGRPRVPNGPVSVSACAQGVEMLSQIGQQLLQVLGNTHLGAGDADFAIGLAMHLAGCGA